MATVEIFFCYARDDEALCKELEKQLRALKRQGLIDMWHDRNINAGTEWEREIDAHLNTAHIILLLISPDFMDSDYCYGIEMQRAMKRHELGEAIVIPIILRPVYWQGAPFGKLQALPTNAKAITSSDWHSLDEAFFNVIEGVLSTVRELLGKQRIENGKSLYKAKRYQDALAAYEQVILFDTNNTEIYKLKGNALYRLQKYKEALEMYDQQLRIGTKDADTHNRKGIVLEQMRHYHEALIAYEQSIKLDPNLAITYLRRGNLLCKLASYHEALIDYEQAIRLRPSEARFHNSKGDALYKLNCYSEALVAYENAIKLEQNNNLYKANSDKILKILKSFSLSVESRTHLGVKQNHESNESSLFAAQGKTRVGPHFKEWGLFIVSDGGVKSLEGKTYYGNYATFLAIHSVIHSLLPKLLKNNMEDPIRTLSNGIRISNRTLYQCSIEENVNLGATLTAILLIENIAYVANVGDSRAYLHSPSNGLRRITNDHSVVMSLAEAGIIKLDDIYTHPKRDQVYRCLGERAEVEVDLFTVPLHNNDKLFLCSHALWLTVHDLFIEEILGDHSLSLKSACDTLIKRAIEVDKEKDISIITTQIK